MANKIKVDNAVLKRLAQKEKRRIKGSNTKRRYFLIVCEGTKTEPNYFEALKKELPRGILEKIDIEGLGKNTLSIIEEAIKLREQAYKERNWIYDEVWAVFDKDSFPEIFLPVAIISFVVTVCPVLLNTNCCFNCSLFLLLSASFAICMALSVIVFRL